MKFANLLIKGLLSAAFLGLLVYSNETHSKQAPAQPPAWANLFSQARDPNCGQTPASLAMAATLDLSDTGGVSWNGPRKKINEWDKQQGYGPSAYFFDYIDDVFQSDVTKEFQRMLDEAKKVPLPDVKEIADPYSLDKMVAMLAQTSTPAQNLAAGTNPTTPPAAPTDPNDQTLLNKLKSIVSGNQKVFNEAGFKAGLTVPQIYAIIKAWGWTYNPAELGWARKILDKYDFDGDGRLNPREFIIFTIIHNKNQLGLPTCKNCYNDLIQNKIDPIYNFIDCDNDNKVSAEDMWHNLQNLKRTNANKANIYQCLLNNKKYRTTAMNDFVLKNMWDNDGFVSRNEFRVGILLGYWDRQTDPEKIYTDDTRTFKQLRWGTNGETDVVCSRILAAQNPTPPPNINTMAATPTASTPGLKTAFR